MRNKKLKRVTEFKKEKRKEERDRSATVALTPKDSQHHLLQL